MIINVQCTSCHTRYRIDETVLPEGTPTFKCSRCNHVFSVEPREAIKADAPASEQPELTARESSAKESRTASETNVAAARREDTTVRKAASAPPPPVTPPVEPSGAGRPGTEELLNKSMRAELDESNQGENLAFDFSDEPAPGDETQSARAGGDRIIAKTLVSPVKKKPIRWQVGDEPEVIEEARRVDGFRIGTAALEAPEDAEILDDAPAEEFVDESRAPIYNRGIIHSSRFFLTLLMLVAAGFAVTAATIHSAPAGALEALSQLPILGDRFAQPIAPARMVAIRNVSSEYQSSKDGRPALVIRGEGENVSQTALHTVRISARLASAGTGSDVEVYCGNNLIADIRQMTSHEIEVYQKQGPPADFSLEPSASSPFVIVFLNPTAKAGSFDLAVTQAQPTDEASAPAPAS